MRIKELFNTMYKLPRCGIYGLVNHKYKRIYISHSQDICTSIARLLRDIHHKITIYKQFIKDASKLEFVYLENINNCDSKIDIQMKEVYYIQQYKQLGYELYNTKNRLPNFKVMINVNEDLNRVYVQLVSRIYKKYTVGVFNNMNEAMEFSTVFEKMDIIIPVYATNDLTREYFSKNKFI